MTKRIIRLHFIFRVEQYTSSDNHDYQGYDNLTLFFVILDGS